MKQATTWEEQKDILQSRGLIFDDDDKCIDFLKSVNYYRLSAYLLPFKKTQPVEHYEPNVTLEKIMVIYDFDKELRHILFSIIEEIETYLRTQITYYVAHNIGAYSYLDEAIFKPSHDRDKFINVLKDNVSAHKHTPIVQRYIGERFPIWVIIEFFSIGALSRFYGDLRNEYQKEIATTIYRIAPRVLTNWFVCITNLRNRCAHYERLYYSLFSVQPILPNKQVYTYGKRLFGQLIVLKHMFRDPFRWVNYVERIDDLVRTCREYIDLNHIGFPDDWKETLLSGIKILTATVN